MMTTFLRSLTASPFLFGLKDLESAKQIDLRQVDKFVAASVENRSQHEQTEALGLLIKDRWRHRQFLPCDLDLNQCRAVMFESLRNRGFNLVWGFGAQSKKSCSLGDLREIRTTQVGCKIEKAVRFHFQFHERQGIVLEDNHLHWQFVLFQRQYIPHEHGEATITR